LQGSFQPHAPSTSAASAGLGPQESPPRCNSGLPGREHIHRYRLPGKPCNTPLCTHRHLCQPGAPSQQRRGTARHFRGCSHTRMVLCRYPPTPHGTLICSSSPRARWTRVQTEHLQYTGKHQIPRGTSGPSGTPRTDPPSTLCIQASTSNPAVSRPLRVPTSCGGTCSSLFRRTMPLPHILGGPQCPGRGSDILGHTPPYADPLGSSTPSHSADTSAYRVCTSQRHSCSSTPRCPHSILSEVICANKEVADQPNAHDTPCIARIAGMSHSHTLTPHVVLPLHIRMLCRGLGTIPPRGMVCTSRLSMHWSTMHR